MFYVKICIFLQWIQPLNNFWRNKNGSLNTKIPAAVVRGGGWCLPFPCTAPVISCCCCLPCIHWSNWTWVVATIICDLLRIKRFAQTRGCQICYSRIQCSNSTAQYWVTQKLPQIYIANHATFPSQICKLQYRTWIRIRNGSATRTHKIQTQRCREKFQQSCIVPFTSQ